MSTILRWPPCLLIFVVFISLFPDRVLAGDDGDRSFLESPDGLWQADPSGNFPDIHYQITKVQGPGKAFKTSGPGNRPNDVKTGAFSPDSRSFAAVYMGSLPSPHTWIGIWELRTGKRVLARDLPGYSRNDAMFDWHQWFGMPVELSQVRYDRCPVDQKPVASECLLIWFPRPQDGAKDPEKAVVLSFCCGHCREAFAGAPDQGVATIKSSPHFETPVTLADSPETCPICGSPADRNCFILREGQMTFFCGDTCLARFSHTR